ncbi:MAG: aspartate/glutamate racemase family protein [Bacillota bacterium]|nr:aspartate/glutamate racemase family protein [Bacillota bacterium]
MKTIGLIGGMSWESTSEYYRIINEEVRAQKGALNSAKCILVSVNFAEIEMCQREGDWNQAAAILIKAAQALEKGGAEFILICANTMHKVAEQIQVAVSIPIIHIADATAEKIRRFEISTVGLLGTKYTMEENFYISRLENKGINVIVPNAIDREVVHHVIFNELCLGQISSKSKKKYLEIIEELHSKGAEGIILGCTEISLLIKDMDINLPIFDTTRIHATKAVVLSIKS